MTREQAWDLLIGAVRDLAAEEYLPPEIARQTLGPQTRIEDLGIDSIGKTSLLNELEDRAGVGVDDTRLGEIETLGEIARLLVAAAEESRA